jgi:hypothetical protein
MAIDVNPYLPEEFRNSSTSRDLQRILDGQLDLLEEIFGDKTPKVVATTLSKDLSMECGPLSPEILATHLEDDGYRAYYKDADCDERVLRIYRKSKSYSTNVNVRSEYRKREYLKLLQTMKPEEVAALETKVFRGISRDHRDKAIEQFRIRLMNAMSNPISFGVVKVTSSNVGKDDHVTGNPWHSKFRTAADSGQILSSINNDTKEITGVPRKKDRPSED